MSRHYLVPDYLVENLRIRFPVAEYQTEAVAVQRFAALVKSIVVAYLHIALIEEENFLMVAYLRTLALAQDPVVQAIALVVQAIASEDYTIVSAGKLMDLQIVVVERAAGMTVEW